MTVFLPYCLESIIVNCPAISHSMLHNLTADTASISNLQTNILKAV